MLRNSFHIIFIVVIFTINLIAQTPTNIKKLKSNFAKGENKEKYYTNLVKNINNTFSGNLDQNYSEWRKRLRDAQSILYKNNSVKKGLYKALNLPTDKNLKLQRVALEVAFTLYKNDFRKEIQQIFNETIDKISFAISTYYLLNGVDNIEVFRETLKSRFPKFNNDGLLLALLNDLSPAPKNDSFTEFEIIELLNHSFQNGKSIIYSFHRKNRIYPGITIIKKPDGKFVKNDDGSLFHIPQLALSYSNLPGYIPNCNTPQGIYSVVGWYISPTVTIGPTPNILVRSPFEVSPKIFFHKDNTNARWSLEDYQSLIPKGLINNRSIYESFYAGKTGRRVIIMHGSTDETKYFKDKPYFPLTPTRGCLSSKEIWSEKTGKCIESDQVKLINAYKSTRQKYGFLIVIEINDEEKPIKIEEISEIIKKSPQR